MVDFCFLFVLPLLNVGGVFERVLRGVGLGL